MLCDHLVFGFMPRLYYLVHIVISCLSLLLGLYFSSGLFAVDCYLVAICLSCLQLIVMAIGFSFRPYAVIILLLVIILSFTLTAYSFAIG